MRSLALLMIVSTMASAQPSVKHSSGRMLPHMPAVTKPIAFDTPAADKVLEAMQVFPVDNPWNQDVSKWPLRANSNAIVASIGNEKVFRVNTDMGFVLVPPNQKKIDVKLVTYPDESDKGPYPMTDDVPIEGWPASYKRSREKKGLSLLDVQMDTKKEGGDRHALVVDPTAGKLYEFYQMKRTSNGWQAAQASIFDLTSNKLRPAGWTSADAAGLPIFPAVVRYDEIQRGMVEHAMRFTVRRSKREYVYPATHYASRLTDKDLPRMGERLRLKADYDISKFSKEAQAILKGLKKYGMLVADNGIEWAISVAPDERIPDLSSEMRRIKGSAFEVVVKPD